MRKFLRRLSGSWLFRGDVLREIKEDPSSVFHATLVVLGAGVLLGALEFAFETPSLKHFANDLESVPFPWISLFLGFALGGGFAMLLTWHIYNGLLYLVSTRLFQFSSGDSSYSRFAATTGYAVSLVALGPLWRVPQIGEVLEWVAWLWLLGAWASASHIGLGHTKIRHTAIVWGSLAGIFLLLGLVLSA